MFGKLRRALFVQLNPVAWPRQGMSPLNRFLITTILLSVILAILGTEPDLQAPYARLFLISDFIFACVFGLEYLTRIWVAREEAEFSGLRGRVRYILTPMALIDLIAVAPFFITLGGNDAFILRLFRLLRILSLAKFARYTPALQNIARAIRERQYELILSVVLALIVMLLSASALYFFERSHSPESFGSIPKALWWGVATVTKVGYGGAFPMTVFGKFFAGLFALAAVGVVAVPTGILAASFSNAFQYERTNKGADERRLEGGPTDTGDGK